MLVPQYVKPVLCTVFYFSIQFVFQKLYLFEIASEIIAYSRVQKRKCFSSFVRKTSIGNYIKLFLLSHRQTREHLQKQEKVEGVLTS